MVDRFGEDLDTRSVPQEIENLFYQILVKMEALRAGIQSIGRRRDQIAVRIPQGVSLPIVAGEGILQGGAAERSQAQTPAFPAHGTRLDDRRGRFRAPKALFVLDGRPFTSPLTRPAAGSSSCCASWRRFRWQVRTSEMKRAFFSQAGAVSIST